MKRTLRDVALRELARGLGLENHIARIDERAAAAEARVARLEGLLRQLVAQHDDKQTPAIQQLWRDAMAEVLR